ncbi:copper resistance protein B [uncultured Sphingomonas sp.]|uniref:copper resistance protein B n=1 Tax=uncultured Sphingomonas sp. TaxID=158754 RepID=UPI002607FD4E|nr:copper resistance protein B [uncultured Sphingomonas sp.]
MSRPFAALAAAIALTLAMPAAAQDMPGMKMPAPAKGAAAVKPEKGASPKKSSRRPVPRREQATRAMPEPAVPAAVTNTGPPMSAMPGMADKPNSDMKGQSQSMPGMDMSGDHAGHDMAGMPGMTMPAMAQGGTALPAGNAPAPPPPTDHYADRYFPATDMSRARMAMMHEQGGQALYQVMFNLAEYQARRGRDGYRWDGEAFVGGDINRLWLKSEGAGVLRDGVESAEIQALYSRAIGPYFNLQAGVRHDFQPRPTRTYATVGFEGLAPYMFEVEGALFLSNKGEVLGRLEGYYDQRLTQRLILQPRVEFNLSAQDVPELRLGSGLTDAELGLRLRYEVSRQFAPYIGVSYEAKTGRTADFARADGKDPATTSFVAGVRFWF